MCVDYIELNKMTIKDKFLILFIDELLYRLYGEISFTKLDLEYRYHRITHQGHYEFLVMPFGFTNAPFTFQSLMNSIFKLFLIKFVSVYFDDILIYIKYWEEHLQHVDRVLKLSEEHQINSKPPKCAFGGSRNGIFGSYCFS